MTPEVLKELIRASILAPFLAWALWMETQNRRSMIDLLDRSIVTMEQVKTACKVQDGK